MLTIKQFTFNPVQENTYVLYNDKDACIIDPGCYFGNERSALKHFIEEQKLVPKLLLNTHCHLDHVFGNKFIYEEYGLRLHLHQSEEQVLKFAPEAGLRWNMPFENYRGELIFLKEGDTIELDGDRLKVLFTPGHSPGSICFYCEAQKFIISGDVLFRMSIGRTDLPGGDFDTLISSINDQLFTLPDDVKVYAGHGEPTTIGFEKKNNPFLK
ncbi:MAG: MBL fold metallo-hydrolase [Bacteroidetes bacterium]|nr:MBL fold metallo-hydrolase [Bacteroidota bacterium]MBS1974484.1 MBL fold metallo-hydrolase [Bacteroidota bacterium]